jgi:hypothetical protein
MHFLIADIFARDHDLPMRVRIFGVLLSTILLSGCSYTYDVLAVAINGHLAFIVDPKSRKQPDCIRSIHVETDQRLVPSRQPVTTHNSSEGEFSGGRITRLMAAPIHSQFPMAKDCRAKPLFMMANRRNPSKPSPL